MIALAKNNSLITCFVVILFAAVCVCAEEATQQPQSPPTVSVAQDTPEEATLTASQENSAAAPVVLDLVMVQRRALGANPSLQVVAEQVAQARQYVHQARSLYFPQLSATYRATRTRMENDASEDLLDSEGDGRQTHRTHRTQAFRVPRIVEPDTPSSDLFPSGFDPANVTEAIRAFSGMQGALGNLSGMGGLGGFSLGEDTKNYTLGVTAGLLLFDGFSRRMTCAMARFGREETEAAYQEARRLLLDAVALSFFGVQLARENIEVARADKEFNARLVKEMTLRRDLGKASLSDVLNFEVRQRAAEAALLNAEKEYQSARIALALVMGEPDVRLPDTFKVAPLPDERAENMYPPDETAEIQYALECRPDLIQKGHGVERAKAAVKNDYGKLSPRVSLLASWNDQRMKSGSYEQENESTTVGVDVSYDIFTGGRKISRIIEAKHAKRQAEYKRTETERKVISDVRQALLDLKIAQDQLVLQRTTSEYVQRNRDLVEKEYQAGKAPLVRLNQSQRDLVEAQARLAFTQVNLLKAWHELRTATAETLEAFHEDK